MAAIVAADLLFKFSVSAAAGNTTVGTAAGSLGDQVSTTQITDATINNLFADITAAENSASTPKYKCFFVHNNNGANALQNAVMYLSAETAGGASVAIGVDTTAASAVGAAAAQALTVANDNTAPAGVTFSSPTTQGAGIALGNIPAGNVKAVWVRVTPANTVALNNDGATLMLYGETAAA